MTLRSWPAPLERVDLNELVPKHKKSKPNPFSMEEIEAILSTAGEYCERFHNLIEFAFFSGLRPEELAGLQWDNVDFKRDQVSITDAAMLSINQTRHTYASHQLSSGENPLYVASQMGHRGTALLDVYATWAEEWKDEQAGVYGG